MTDVVTGEVPALVLAVAIVANGLLAGLFFAFACAIVPAFRRLDDRAYVHAFRAINAAILNPWFLTVFATAPLGAVAAVATEVWWGSGERLALLVAAAGCSVVAFVITAAANVPRNRELERARADTEAGCAAARARFEAPWRRWNVLRTLTAVIAFALFVVAAATG